MGYRRGAQLEDYFFAAFGSMAGIIVFMTIIAIYTLVWAGTGIMLLYKYNKKNTSGIGWGRCIKSHNASSRGY